ncbi:GGDEF domain-containing protein [Aurantiacibacter sp. MUD11]|uniref:GGDEF domain-containing protein n=1 Tax=Aurantiacibacter sp. MUD11 TaxID=3003265 RepID=UPI0022AB36E4|nr:GGDEF domain-containing protein [Aurantiacibacter sp. MUD11]WAT18712.1 GGDEF domain-containing protein [Aurantiacibacter sp. MUD11]
MTTPLMAVLFAAMFVVLWWRGRMGGHVLAFGGAYILFSAGFAVTHWLPTSSNFVFVLTQAFYSFASALLVWAACRRSDRPPLLGVQASIYAIAVVTLCTATVLSDDAGPRVVIANAGYGMMFFVGVISLLGAPRRSFVDTLVIAILAFNTVDFMVRPMMTVLAEGVIPAEFYRQSLYYSIIGLVLSIKSLLTAMVLVGACAYDLAIRMRENSDRDTLTGLRNRRAFEHDIAAPLMRARDAKVPVSLVIADIDHFKQVNDLWGHQAGDQAIAAFGKLIDGMIREHDISGRIGGEEFCVLVWNCPHDAACRLAERLRVAFARQVHPAIGENIRLTASFGVAALREDETYDRLFSRADAALYRAKDSGRDRVLGEHKVDHPVAANESGVRHVATG